MAESRAKRGYGLGSLSVRNGVYYGRWRLGDGQVQKRLGHVRSKRRPEGLTRSQAEGLLRQAMAEAAAKARTEKRKAQKMTVSELGARYIVYARERRGLKASTLSDYESHVRVHLAPYFGSRPIQQLDARAIEAFDAHMRRKRGAGRRGGNRLHPKTVANIVGSLAVLLNFAVKKKLIDSNPMLAADLPRTSVDEPLEELRFLEPGQVDRLIDSVVPGRYELLDRALYTLAAYSGLRQGELRGLRWEHIDFERSIVHVLESVSHYRRSSPKGKRRRRLPLAPTAMAALQALRRDSGWDRPDHPVFAAPATGNPMAVTPLMNRYRKALKAAGLPEDFSFHDLRHTFGTTMARAGVPVSTIQAWMGHADIQTTQIYMHYAPATKDANQIDAAFGKGPSDST